MQKSIVKICVTRSLGALGTHRTQVHGLPGACRATPDDLTRSYPEHPSFSPSGYFTDPDFGGSGIDDGGSGFYDYFG